MKVFYRVIDAIVLIATNLGGTITANTGNRVADALDVIAVKAAGLKGGGIPEIKTADKGKFLHINSSTGKAEYADALPAYPAGDGTYVLTLTKTAGATTLSWVSSV